MPANRLPSVSVVIPNYNYGRYLPQAIDSALAQSYMPREIIVVDDGSTDETFLAIKPYRDRIRYIYQKNAGLSAARNTGIRAAESDWVAMLDADDIWMAQKLLLQMQCAYANPEVVVIGAVECSSPAVRFCPPQTELDPLLQYTLMETSDLLGGLPFGASSVVAKRTSLFEAGLFNETRRSVEDREMWLKLSLLGRAARVNQPLWMYRIHPNQMNANPGRMRDNYRNVIDDFLTQHPANSAQRAKAYAYFHYDSAMAFFDAGKPMTALNHLIRSWLLHPLPMRQGAAERNFHRHALFFKAVLGQRRFDSLLALQKKAFRQGSTAPQVLPVPENGSNPKLLASKNRHAAL